MFSRGHAEIAEELRRACPALDGKQRAVALVTRSSVPVLLKLVGTKAPAQQTEALLVSGAPH